MNDQPDQKNAESDPSTDALPPVLYIPTLTDSAGNNHLQMHELPDGRIALPVYTALDRLADALGGDQAWALLTLEALAQARTLSPFDVILRDARPVASPAQRIHHP